MRGSFQNDTCIYQLYEQLRFSAAFGAMMIDTIHFCHALLAIDTAPVTVVPDADAMDERMPLSGPINQRSIRPSAWQERQLRPEADGVRSLTRAAASERCTSCYLGLYRARGPGQSAPTTCLFHGFTSTSY